MNDYAKETGMGVNYKIDSFAGQPALSVQNDWSARNYMNAVWNVNNNTSSTTAGAWYTLPPTTFVAANDAMPNINSSIASSAVSNNITYLTSGPNAGSFQLPTLPNAPAAKWNFSVWSASTGGHSGGEFRWCCPSSPAWTGSNGVSYPARSYTGARSGDNLALNYGFVLKTEGFSTAATGELSSSVVTTLPGGSIVQPLLYLLTPANTQSSVGVMYLQATCLGLVW